MKQILGGDVGGGAGAAPLGGSPTPPSSTGATSAGTPASDDSSSGVSSVYRISVCRRLEEAAWAIVGTLVVRGLVIGDSRRLI